MKVIIASPVFKVGDAIGHDVLGQYQCLREEGIETHIYSEIYEPDTAGLVSEDCLRLLEDKDTLLLYHHGASWEKGIEILKKSRCRKVVKYHNITPAHYFLPYSSEYFKLCLLGRWQNREIIGSGIDMLISDSSENSRDFIDGGFPEENSRVLPPFTSIHDFDSMEEDAEVSKGLFDGKVNVFFVGRVAPNKGHRHILYTAYYYKMLFGTDIRFIIAGHVSPNLVKYYKELLSLVKHLGIDDVVEFVGRVTPEGLVSYYKGSHVFLLLSEHEGFCVPILEAQYLGLPIVAYGASAVGETMGEDQLVYDQINYETLSAAIDIVTHDEKTGKFLADAGYRNFSKYEKSHLKRKLISSLSELI